MKKKINFWNDEHYYGIEEVCDDESGIWFGMDEMRQKRDESGSGTDEEGTKRDDELAEMDEGQKRRDKYVQNELNCFTRQEEGTRTKNYYSF